MLLGLAARGDTHKHLVLHFLYYLCLLRKLELTVVHAGLGPAGV